MTKVTFTFNSPLYGNFVNKEERRLRKKRYKKLLDALNTLTDKDCGAYSYSEMLYEIQIVAASELIRVEETDASIPVSYLKT